MPIKNKRLKKWLCHMLLAVMLTLILGFQALAAGSIDLDADVTLTLIYKDDARSIVGAEFDLYQIGEISEDGEFALTGDFANYPVVLDDLDNTGWRNLAATLMGYAQRDHLSPIDTGKTDESGVLKFPKQLDSLNPGVYLAAGHKHAQDGKIYTAEPFIAWMPDWNEALAEWSYDGVTVMPKHESSTADSETGTINRKVLKAWNDNGYEKKRPKEITVELLQDGNVYDVVTLTAENNWRYTWENLSDEYTWNVVEKEQKNYTVSVGREGITFVVTNTYVPKNPGNPGGDDDGGGGGGNSGGSGGTSGGPGDSTIIEEFPDLEVPLANLPQTGQLWWPVPILIAAGLVFLIAGFLLNKDKEYE